jgi:hypothetical protein
MFDLHVHSAPDVVDRLGDDVDLAGWYGDAGAAGFVLKSHFESTVGRAALLRHTSGLEVYGGIALNAQAGGLNPAAVAVALAMGGRVVWMPTVHARSEASPGAGPGGDPGSLAEFSARLTAGSFAAPPVDWAAQVPLTRIFELIAEADAVLATGHLSGAEVAWLIPAASAAGVRRILLTHPSFTHPAISAEEASTLTDGGALAEVTAYQLLHQEGCDASFLAAFIRRVGPDRVVLSSDAGQPDSPRPPVALQQLIDALAGEGLDRARLDAMASEVPHRLVDPDR